MERIDETTLTEITIRPDGRVFIFGMSREVLEVLVPLCPDDESLRARLECLENLPRVASDSQSLTIEPQTTETQS